MNYSYLIIALVVFVFYTAVRSFFPVEKNPKAKLLTAIADSMRRKSVL